jgi:hypothetical protein
MTEGFQGHAERDHSELTRNADPLMLPTKVFGVSAFSLPGHGSSSSWCGEWRLRMCSNVDGHRDGSLDNASAAGKYVVETYRASCGKISCPICMEKANGKTAKRIEWKFQHFFDVEYVKHVTASVPKPLYDVDAKKLRLIAISMLKACGVHGGCVIYHPWRERCAVCGGEIERYVDPLDENEGQKHGCVECGSSLTTWVYGPHFHCIGVGKVHGAGDNYEKNGWVVVNHGIRKSIIGTAHYQLSHCGVAKGFSTVVWFGSILMKKVDGKSKRRKFPPLPLEKHDCPICGEKMTRPLLDPWMKLLMKSGVFEKGDEGIYFADPEMFDHWDPWDGEGGGIDD